MSELLSILKEIIEIDELSGIYDNARDGDYWKSEKLETLLDKARALLEKK